jgi:pyridoxamine 5'-phosphate oxidase
MTLAHIRREYLGAPLSEQESDADPMRQFALWFDQVRELEPDPTAMALATATRDGRPSVRTVLLKGVDDRGFVFYTNYASRKAREMDESGRASLLFFWRSVERQVRIEGVVERVADEEADAYFATRPLESRWSVYASKQSSVVDSRVTLDTRFAEARERYGDAVPRPAWWGGYRVVPDEIEFWQGRTNRMHDRLVYSRQPSAVSGQADGGWERRRLAP